MSRVFEYAEDRSAFLDVRDAVASALDATEGYTDSFHSLERADAAIAALRPVLERTLTRRLATEPRIREMVAAALVTAVLP